MWQSAALTVIEDAAMAHGAVFVRAVGSVAAGNVDPWSDLDAVVVVPDGKVSQFWADGNWLPEDLGRIVARSQWQRPTGVGTRLLLADGRGVDVTIVETTAAEEHLRMLADLRPVVDAATLDGIATSMVFDAVMAIARCARGERLLATRLTVGLLAGCLEAAMAVREMATGTCVHPGPTAQDTVADLLPAMPAAPQPADVLQTITAALDCFEQIIADSPTRPVFPRAVLDRLISRATRDGRHRLTTRVG
jgi:hypothetical protein